MPLLLSEKDVRAVLSMDDLIDTMSAALVQFSTAAVQQPLRTVVAVSQPEPRGGGFYAVMPAFIPQPAALGTKLVTVYESNAARALAIVGSGVQARSHIEALIRVRRFDEIRVWGRDPGRLFSLVEEMLPRV